MIPPRYLIRPHYYPGVDIDYMPTSRMHGEITSRMVDLDANWPHRMSMILGRSHSHVGIRGNDSRRTGSTIANQTTCYINRVLV